MILIENKKLFIYRMTLKSCPSDKVLNPLTKRCVSKTGSIGKKILNNKVSETSKKPSEPKEPKKVSDLKKLNAEIYFNIKKLKPTKPSIRFMFYGSGSLSIDKISKYYRKMEIEQIYRDVKRIHLFDKTKDIFFSISDIDYRQKTFECEVMSKVYYHNEYK